MAAALGYSDTINEAVIKFILRELVMKAVSTQELAGEMMKHIKVDSEIKLI